MTTTRKEEVPDAVQKQVIDLAAVFLRERRTIAGAAAHLRGPGVGAGGVADDRKRERLRDCPLGVLIEEERNRLKTGA